MQTCRLKQESETFVQEIFLKMNRQVPFVHTLFKMFSNYSIIEVYDTGTGRECGANTTLRCRDFMGAATEGLLQPVASLQHSASCDNTDLSLSSGIVAWPLFRLFCPRGRRTLWLHCFPSWRKELMCAVIFQTPAHPHPPRPLPICLVCAYMSFCSLECDGWE